MPQAISSARMSGPALALAERGLTPSGAAGQPQTRETFARFSAETLFRLMLKALRSTERPVAYLGGSTAERLFRGRLDEAIVDQLARSHGSGLTQNLSEAFAQKLDVRA